MAVNTGIPDLGIAELNAPDLDDHGELDVIHYAWPEWDDLGIADDKLKAAYLEAKKYRGEDVQESA